MSDSSPSPEVSRAAVALAGDMTAKARIRNAAFELHAAQGVAKTTMREVARAAGVTHGLVVHHFGNSAGLQRAVQQHMLELLLGALDAAPTEGDPAEVSEARDRAVERMYEDHPAYIQYLRRALLDPDQVDADLLDRLSELTVAQTRLLREAGVVSEERAVETTALSVLLRDLGPRLLQPVVDEFWARLAPRTSSEAPRIEVRVSEPR